MCHALLRVSYSNNTEPSGTIVVEEEADLQGKIEEVMHRPGVVKVTVYKRQTTHKQVTTWETESHD